MLSRQLLHWHTLFLHLSPVFKVCENLGIQTQSWCSSAGAGWERAGWHGAAPGEEFPWLREWSGFSKQLLLFYVSSSTFFSLPTQGSPGDHGCVSFCLQVKEGCAILPCLLAFASLWFVVALVGASAVGSTADSKFLFPPFTQRQRWRLRLVCMKSLGESALWFSSTLLLLVIWCRVVLLSKKIKAFGWICFIQGLLYTVNGNRLGGLISIPFPAMLVAYYTDIIQSQIYLGFLSL